MSHRRRGVLFGLLSLAAAFVAASAVARQQEAIEQDHELRPVLIARSALAPGSKIRQSDVEVRRFPATFVPGEALIDPVRVLGLEPVVRIPPGAYLYPGLFTAPARPAAEERFASGRTPVQVPVAGAGPAGLLEGGLVDVLVTRDSTRGLGGSTRVAVRRAGLERVSRRPGGSAVATLIVRRPDALLLIEAASYAREIRLIATGQ